MDEKWIEQIRQNMEQKSTEELLRIWEENDREEWSDEAFVAIRRSLEARGENPGPQAQTVSSDEPAHASLSERPGCVTVTALLLGMGAAVTVIRGISNVLVMGDGYGNSTESLVVSIVTNGIIAGLYLLLAIGLWQLKNWARIIFIVLTGLSLPLFIALGGILTFLPVVVGLVVGGYYIYWFASHGEYFH